ncbi:dynamin family protein [Desulfococcus sp.]|uniref:dynamin family protein n=1 Tax=Desulfococcus sp. TaxID=2025834 RepID=UPI003D107E0D
MLPERQGRDAIAHRLNVLITLVRAARFFDIEARAKVEKELLLGGISRIAVVGEAASGKSTFINRKVLSEDILPMTGGTAVPVEIHNSPDRRMEIIPYVERSNFPMTGNGMKSGGMTGLRVCEGPAVIIADPTPADVMRHVSGSTLEARERLAETTARVRIFLDTSAPTGLILVDTPGIGPVNRATVATRYRILPGCDDIFFLPLDRGLSSAERAFLDSPALTGRRIRSLLPGAGWSRQDSDESSSWSVAAHDRRLTFAVRAEPVIRHQAFLARTRCDAEMSARRKSATECRRIETEIGILETEIRIEAAKQLSRLNVDLTALKTRMSEVIEQKITTAAEGISLPVLTTLESAVAGCTAETMAAIQSLAKQYESKSRELLAPWNVLIQRELGVVTVPGEHRGFHARVLAAIALARINPYSILADILPGMLTCKPAVIVHRLEAIAMDVPRRVESVFRPVEELFPAEWNDEINGRMNTVRQGISAARRGPMEFERESLLRTIRTKLHAIARKNRL